MPEGAFLPPWLQQGADPAAHAARGFSLGLQAGAQEAEQRFREQQEMLQQQKSAQQEAQWQAEFGLQSAEAARKADAFGRYRGLISQGMDPIQAILQVPELGGTTEAAALRAQMQASRQVPKFTPGDPGTGQPAAFLGPGFAQQVKSQSNFQPGPVQSYPVIDPQTGKPLPGFIAVPSPTGKGMDVRMTKPPATLSPTAAANLLAKLGELEFSYPGIKNKLGPILQARLQSIAPQGAKEPITVRPFPKSKEDAIVGEPYQTKMGPMRWDGQNFVPLETETPSEATPDDESGTGE